MKTIEKIQSIPTIDPIATIDEMIEELEKHDKSLWFIKTKQSHWYVCLEELKYRLSIIPKL